MGQLYLVRHSVSVCFLTITFIPHCHSLSRAHKSLKHRQTELGLTFYIRECSLTITFIPYFLSRAHKSLTHGPTVLGQTFCVCVFWQLLLFHIPFQKHTKDLHMGRLYLDRRISRLEPSAGLSTVVDVSPAIKANVVPAQRFYSLWNELWRQKLCLHRDVIHFGTIPFEMNYEDKCCACIEMWFTFKWIIKTNVVPAERCDFTFKWIMMTKVVPSQRCDSLWNDSLWNELWWQKLCLHRDVIHFGTIPFEFEMNYEDECCTCTEMWFTFKWIIKTYVVTAERCDFTFKWIIKTNAVPATEWDSL